MKHEDVRISKIKIGDRHRVDFGDIEALAANIREMGLLQPIGVDPRYNLIFGSRRLEACKDILEWSSIPAVILNIKSIIAGEYAENEFRKQFTPSERKAIGEAIERDELGGRHGGDRKSRAPIGSLEKGKTVALAAKRVGFSEGTYQRTKTVVDKGAPDLVQAMDSGKLSISAASVIASQPAAEQRRIVQMPKDEQREIVKQIRQTKADREADERRAQDVRLYRGLYDAVHFIATFCSDPKEAWAGLWRVSAFKFADDLPRALEYLARLKREHPNETRNPQLVTQKAK